MQTIENILKDPFHGGGEPINIENTRPNRSYNELSGGHLPVEQVPFQPNWLPPPSERVRTMASSDELTDAKIAAVEARTDTKIVRMEGKLDLVLSKLGDMDSRISNASAEGRSTRSTVVVTGVVATIALATLMVAIVALLPAVFGLGEQIRDIVSSELSRPVDSGRSASE